MLSKEEIEKAKEKLKNLHPRKYWQRPDTFTYELKPDIELTQAIETLLQYIEQLEQYLERISKQLDNVAIDQIPIGIAELQFKYKSIEQENNKQNKIIDEMLIFLSRQDLGYYNRKSFCKPYKPYNKEDWKQYFEEKVGGENEIREWKDKI